MNLNKSIDFFDPNSCEDRITIIGCGAIGSTVAENLVRFGLTNIALYDFDVVTDHNIANQIYTSEDINKLKVEALKQYLCKINPDLENTLKIHAKPYTDEPLSGHVFLCVDNIDTRREIATNNKYNKFIKTMFDFRMRLTDAQHYAANWSDNKMVDNFIKSMEFTREEAQAETPVSACNLALSIAPTVRVICAYGVNNFINFVKTGSIKKMILIDMNTYTIDVF